MLFEFGFYSSLLLISFSQGIIYSFLLLKKGMQTKIQAHYWLGLFVLLCSLYIAPWMLGFAGWYDNQPYRDVLFYIPFQHLYFIGPVIYCYTQSLLNPSFRFRGQARWHLAPGFLYLSYILFMWFYDKIVFGGNYFYANGSDKDFDNWYQKTGLISMVIYFALTIRYYNLYKKLMYQVVSYADNVLFTWIKNYLCAFLLMLLLPVAFDGLAYFYPGIDTYKGTWWFFLCFSLIMYYIAITGYSNSVQAKVGFRLSIFDTTPIALLLEGQTTTIQSEINIDDSAEIKKAVIPDLREWKSKIQALIQKEKLYRNPELTLTDVSKKLQTNAAVISKVVNQGFEMNFNDFINHYRIEAVKEMLAQGDHKKSTLLGIAYDCGFNSKATFNRAFKKNTGLSPKSYLAAG